MRCTMLRTVGLRTVRRCAAILALGCLIASPAVAETWEGWLSDVACKSQDVSAHPVSCMLGCAKTGYGLVQRNGQFLKFDESGTKKATELLKAARKDEKEIGIKVSGTLKGQTIEVESIDRL